MLHKRSTITMTVVPFRENGRFAECVLWRISSAHSHEGKIPMQESGEKGFCSKGAYFQELTVNLWYIPKKFALERLSKLQCICVTL